MERPIGIFDSGVGGLTVLREVRRRLPAEDLIYFGDTARVPYGIKSAATVTRYALEIGRFLLEQEVKVVVAACNTAASVALEALAGELPIPVIGVIMPGAHAAAAATRNRRVGVIGTESTVASGAYVEAIRSVDPEIQVESRACPLFVPLAEEGWADHPVTRLVAQEYLEPLQTSGVDTLVLGCTHYPLLAAAVQEVVGPEVLLVDSARETAREVAAVLRPAGLARRTNSHPTCRYFVTDSPERFRRVGGRFLGEPLEGVEVTAV